MNQDVLLFQIDELLLGVRVEHVREVVHAVALSAVPNHLGEYEGSINYRGSAVMVFDLRKRLAVPPKPIALTDCLILLDLPGGRTAVRADRFVEILPANELQLTPVDESLDDSNFYLGTIAYGERLAFLVDPLKCLPKSPPRTEAPKL